MYKAVSGMLGPACSKCETLPRHALLEALGALSTQLQRMLWAFCMDVRDVICKTLLYLQE